MTNLIEDIRSKYTGTAAEHELLAKLAKDMRGTFERLERDHEDELRCIRDNLAKTGEAAESLVSLCPLDRTVYDWMVYPDEWSANLVAEAFIGRGLTSDKIKEVLAKVEEIEANRDSGKADATP